MIQFLLLFSASAVAIEPYDHAVSVTVSPLHLVLPIIEATGEFRLADKASVAVIGGFGSVSGYSAAEVGGQGRYYPIGDFDHGLQVGGEVLAIFVSDSNAAGLGLSVGPFLGYKIAARFGLTFDIQLGAQAYVVGASSGTSSARESAVGPLLNINLGWSF